MAREQDMRGRNAKVNTHCCVYESAIPIASCGYFGSKERASGKG
jgi:hypothetical protein